MGYCKGVQRAVDMALHAKIASDDRIYTLGDLIHNRDAVKSLEKKGIFSLPTAEDIPEGATCIIRTHGVERETLRILKEKKVHIIDATCPSVAKIQTTVADKEQEGYRILVVGNPEHPEVKGIAGWGDAIKTGLNFPHGLEETANIKWFVVAQTTLSPELYEEIGKKIINFAKKHAQTVEFFHSICYTTILRREECREISSSSEAVIVIGDPNSNNNRNLVELAGRYCKFVHLISNVSDLASVADKHYQSLGILAGASTPNGLIMEVINRMDQQQKLDNVQIDSVTPVEATEENVAVKQVAPKAKEVSSKEPITMEEAMKKWVPKTIREGMKLKAEIESLDENGVSVSILNAGKNDGGFIAAEQMEYDGNYNPENYKIGDIVDVIVIPRTDNKMKVWNLSKRAYDTLKIEDEAVKQILEGKEFTLACSQVVKGGLLGKLGNYAIFVPAGQIRMGYVKNLEEYVGKKLRLRLLPPKEEPADAIEGEDAQPKRRHNPKRIVASQRVILEEEKKEREDAFWEVMQVNNIMKGKVKRFTNFGAFVSIMNFDCLVHISDLSWTKIKDPSEVLELNKSYEFVVLKVDRESGKVSLGYKQLQKKPYELAAEKYHVGDVIKGKVERIKEFGAFIAIEPGIDGLVHVSEIGHKWIANASEVLKVGDEIDAKIIGFENNKITLSMKALIDPPVAEESVDDADEKPSRLQKFNARAEAAEGKELRKERKSRKERSGDDELREYVSKSSGGATFADLFKNIDMNKFEDKD